MTLSAITPSRRLAALLAAAVAAFTIMFAAAAQPARAWHESYCGHGHSRGFDHGGDPGDDNYYWSKFSYEYEPPSGGGPGSGPHHTHVLEIYYHRAGSGISEYLYSVGPVIVPPNAGEQYGC
jgi:hypothetical protein